MNGPVYSIYCEANEKAGTSGQGWSGGMGNADKVDMPAVMLKKAHTHKKKTVLVVI